MMIRMQSKISASLGALIVVLGLVAQAEQVVDKAAVKAYQRINEFLEKESQGFESQNYQYYLDKAGELLVRERKSLFKSGALIKALEEFVGLEQAVEPASDKCSYDKFLLVRANNLGAEGQAREKWDYDGNQHRPLDRVIRHYTVEHARQCQAEYLARFRELMASGQVPEALLERVEALQGQMVGEREAGAAGETKTSLVSGPALYSLLTSAELNLGRDVELELAQLRRWTELAGDPRRMYLERKFFHGAQNTFGMERAQVGALMMRYMMRPCIDYVRLFRPVLEPADYDNEVLDGFLDPSEKPEQFYRFWAHFRLCRGLMDNFEEHERRVAKLAAKNAYTLAAPYYVTPHQSRSF